MPRYEIPSLPLTGGCQCGKIRYRLNARPLVFYLCHCMECQRHTSSAFGESLRFERAALDADSGLALFTRTSDAGAVHEGWFCPDCGVRIWHGTKTSPEFNIKAGTLDDTSWLAPAGHIWTRSMQRFFRPHPEDLVYETQPDDKYAALRERWAQMYGLT